MARVRPALLAKPGLKQEAAWSALHPRRAISDTEVFMKQKRVTKTTKYLSTYARICRIWPEK